MSTGSHLCLLYRGRTSSAWGEGVAVYGAARGHRRERKTPSLMADMYGFASEEEMEDTKAYLLSHGQYQLEQVGERVSVFGFGFQLQTEQVMVC